MSYVRTISFVISQLNADHWFRIDDSPETFKNAPVSLQLVGRTQEDEAVVAMTEIVKFALDAKQYDTPRL
jgi:hypothetical protein